MFFLLTFYQVCLITLINTNCNFIIFFYYIKEDYFFYINKILKVERLIIFSIVASKIIFIIHKKNHSKFNRCYKIIL